MSVLTHNLSVAVVAGPVEGMSGADWACADEQPKGGTPAAAQATAAGPEQPTQQSLGWPGPVQHPDRRTRHQLVSSQERRLDRKEKKKQQKTKMTKKKQPIKKCLLVFVGFYSIFKRMKKKYTS